MTTALLVIDIQNDYFPGGNMALVNPEQAAGNAARLLQHFRAKSMLVVHIQHISIKNGATFFHPNTDGANIHSLVQPLEHEAIIRKHYPNSFLETNLHECLQKAGVTHLVVAGMMSHMCIDATVRSAAEHSYTITVAENACTTANLPFGDDVIPAQQVHNSFMAALNRAYATVIPTEQVILSI
ncbi:nicotinamidase-related amidase [Sporosarcina luteola]|nr:nicotinamidase-related amidase [Sporosarcina luteola]